MSIQTKGTTTTTTTEYRIELDRNDIVELLNNMNVHAPYNAEIYIYVPGGGDWSNMQLDVDKDNPIVVEWKEVSSDG